MTDGVSPDFENLKRKFESLPDNYVPLVHVKTDWLEGTNDPTKSSFELVTVVEQSEGETVACRKPASPFGVKLDPEFWLSCWYDTSDDQFYPNRRCKHWVTIRQGSIENAIATWQAFRSVAVLAGDAALELGRRPAIADPLQRWLIVLHDTIKPERMVAQEVGNRVPTDEPLPESIRLSNIQIIPDRMGCAVIDDLYEASQKACEALERAAKAETNVDSAKVGETLEQLVKSIHRLDSFASAAPGDDAAEATKPTGGKPKRAATVNERMKAELAGNLETVKGWTAQQWADKLGCGKTTVVDSETWKSLSMLRQQAQAVRRNDRRRK